MATLSVEAIILKFSGMAVMVSPWLIHSTRACTPGETIGMRIGPNEIHIMSRSEG